MHHPELNTLSQEQVKVKEHTAVMMTNPLTVSHPVPTTLETSSKVAKPFILKLLKMINNSTLESICWSKDGDCIVINPVLYPNESSNKISSLYNQLRNYRFKRPIISKPEYCHEHFTRDRPDDMSLISHKAHSKVASSEVMKSLKFIPKL